MAEAEASTHDTLTVYEEFQFRSGSLHLGASTCPANIPSGGGIKNA